jgi:DNA-binding transcriptional ArsR family regulator
VRDRDLTVVADLVGDATRMAMLAELADGRALPAGELARVAGIHPATATAHLRRLVDGGLVRVRVQGRHRYHELAGPRVAAAIEALAHLAPPAPVRSLRQDRVTTALAEARTCYDHLAGRLRAGRRVFARSCLDVTHRQPHLAGALPAALTDRFLDRGWLRRGPGRALRVSTGYDEHLDRWLAETPTPT